MADSAPRKISQRGTRGVQSLIFLASFILSALLALASISITRVISTRAKLPTGGQALLPYYVSSQGFLTLVPLDLLVLAYTSCVILVVATLRILAEAQLAIEENPTHAQALAEKAEKYIEWALNGVVFFVTFEFTTSLTAAHILFMDNYWPGLAICGIITVIARFLMHRVAHI